MTDRPVTGKSDYWQVHLPGHFHLLDFRFKWPVSAAELRRWLRRWLRVKRLPVGTEIVPGEGGND